MHMLAHLGRPDLVPDVPPPRLRGGQIVFYGLEPRVTRVVSAPRSGRFRLSGSGLARLDTVTDPTLCADDEVILFARTAGRLVPPGGEVARVQTPLSLLEPDRDAPSGLVDELCRAVRATIAVA
jgi:hypothetical protein